MAISVGKIIGGIERDVNRFLNDPLSMFDGIGLNKADQNRVDGIRNSLLPPPPVRVAPATGRAAASGVVAPAGGGPVTININITVYPNGVVAGVGATDANVAQPQAVMVPPPPDMRNQLAQSQAMMQELSNKPLFAPAQETAKKKPVRPRR